MRPSVHRPRPAQADPVNGSGTWDQGTPPPPPASTEAAGRRDGVLEVRPAIAVAAPGGGIRLATTTDAARFWRIARKAAPWTKVLPFRHARIKSGHGEKRPKMVSPRLMGFIRKSPPNARRLDQVPCSTGPQAQSNLQAIIAFRPFSRKSCYCIIGTWAAI